MVVPEGRMRYVSKSKMQIPVLGLIAGPVGSGLDMMTLVALRACMTGRTMPPEAVRSDGRKPAATSNP